MTGIYAGFAAVAVYLGARRRLRAVAIPTRSALVLLVVAGGSMAMDGLNSFLDDTNQWRPYEPTNALRLVTGLLAGAVLAVTICYLVAASLWRRVDASRAIVRSWGDAAAFSVLLATTGAAFWFAPGWAQPALALALVLAALAAVASLAMVVTVILTRREGTFVAVGQLSGVAAIALLLAVAGIAIIAAGRFWLERLVGIPPVS
jgi:uncharacterized membrane protein